MGLIATVLSVLRGEKRGAKITQIKIDTGGGDVLLADDFRGVDSPPLSTDYVAAVPGPRTGSYLVVGLLDPKADQSSAPGEYRIYGRNAGGSQVCEVHLGGDGALTLSNSSGVFALESDGTINLNGVQISPDGKIIAGDSLILGGKELNLHVHVAGTLIDSSGKACSGATGVQV